MSNNDKRLPVAAHLQTNSPDNRLACSPKVAPFICNCRQEVVVLKWAIKRCVHLQSGGAHMPASTVHARKREANTHIHVQR